MARKKTTRKKAPAKARKKTKKTAKKSQTKQTAKKAAVRTKAKSKNGKLLPELKKTILAAIRRGATIEHSIAAAGVSKPRFYELRNNDPEFLAELEQANADCIAQIEEVNRRMAFEENGVADRLFFLKARAGYSEKQKVEVSGEDGGPVQILDLSKLSKAELKKLLEKRKRESD